MLTLTPEARRRILGTKPKIGSYYFLDKEESLLKPPPPQPAITIHSKKEPPIIAQVLLGLLCASALILACFL